MELLEQGNVALRGTQPKPGADLDALAARRSIRAQIARLERELAHAFVTAFEIGGVTLAFEGGGEARMLDLGELERIRDQLAERLRVAHVTIAERADIQAANRVRLEQMLLNPAKHRFERVSRRDVGEWGCGVWQLRPRLRLIGM